jgi:hypothetical protein
LCARNRSPARGRQAGKGWIFKGLERQITPGKSMSCKDGRARSGTRSGISSFGSTTFCPYKDQEDLEANKLRLV